MHVGIGYDISILKNTMLVTVIYVKCLFFKISVSVLVFDVQM